MKSLNLPDKKRPVPSVRAFQTWTRDAQKATGVAAERISWLVATTVVVAALQRTVADDGHPLFLVKGGVYIEFNLGLRARTTTDVDILFRGGIDQFQRRLDEVLAEPWGPFELARTAIEAIDAPKLVKPRRFWVQLKMKGSVWRRIQVEVAFPEGDMASQSQPVASPNIGFFGLTTPADLFGVSMDYQVAQKLHAVSDPDEPGYENQRVHDICDLILLKDAFYPGTASLSLYTACVDIFTYRADEATQLGRHERFWPPVFTINDYWRMTYPALAESLGITLTIDLAVESVEAWVIDISAAK